MLGFEMVTFVTCHTATLTAFSTNTYVTRGMMKGNAETPAGLSPSPTDRCPHARVIRPPTHPADLPSSIKTRLGFANYRRSRKVSLRIHRAPLHTAG